MLMVEIDSDTYQVKLVRGDESKAAPLRFLITPERSQNLELLQHLLANTHQAIVLCGPVGVGKTALLEVLRKRLNDEWRWCVVKGHHELTFEDVHDRVCPLLRHARADAAIKNSGHGRSPDACKDVVLAIDDAGEMAPGLFTRFLQFAEIHPDLRLLFVLTHDQWHIKNYSDPAIENCNLVEVKPLLQRECRDFVQHVASLTDSLRFRKGLTDNMIDAVYRDSHGIPARILAHFPETNKPKDGVDPLTVLVVAVACLVFLALYIQWFTTSSPVNDIDGERVELSGNKINFDPRQPFLSLPIGDLLEYSKTADLSGIQQQGFTGADKRAQSFDGAQPELTAAASSLVAPSEKDGMAKTIDHQKVLPDTAGDASVLPTPPKERVEQTGAGEEAESWLAGQPENSYALQLMVLSKASTVQAVIARHAELQAELRVVRRILKGKEKFVLLYGNFPNAESAINAKKSLPSEFKSAMVRKFGTLRKEFPSMPSP